MQEAKYKLASSTWDSEEFEAIQEVLASGRTTMGQRVSEFEEKFADYFGSKYAVMVNSGSSANLLAIAALSHKKSNALAQGSEVIVPTVSWSTTYYPVNQLGLTLRFVDIDLDTLCINVSEVEGAINANTSAILVVNLLGQPANLPELKKLADKHGLYLIEDNCESMGASIDGKMCGSWGDIGTFSTFFSHHINTMEGGVAITDDRELYEIMKSLRAHGWTRELDDVNQIYSKIGISWEDNYRFVLPGYNLRPLEMSGAIGIPQLKKLPQIISKRQKNHEYFKSKFENIPDIQLQTGRGENSSFGFSIILKNNLKGNRNELVQYLERNSIESRPIVSGDFTQQPVMSKLVHHPSIKSHQARIVHDDGLFLGNHHFDIQEEIDYAYEVISDWVTRFHD
jgi:CDP-6-deoxy-D-xylo-4-hexulose-3-dehydrase